MFSLVVWGIVLFVIQPLVGGSPVIPVGARVGNNANARKLYVYEAKVNDNVIVCAADGWEACAEQLRIIAGRISDHKQLATPILSAQHITFDSLVVVSNSVEQGLLSLVHLAQNAASSCVDSIPTSTFVTASLLENTDTTAISDIITTSLYTDGYVGIMRSDRQFFRCIGGQHSLRTARFRALPALESATAISENSKSDSTITPYLFGIAGFACVGVAAAAMMMAPRRSVISSHRPQVQRGASDMTMRAPTDIMDGYVPQPTIWQRMCPCLVRRKQAPQTWHTNVVVNPQHGRNVSPGGGQGRRMSQASTQSTYNPAHNTSPHSDNDGSRGRAKTPTKTPGVSNRFLGPPTPLAPTQPPHQRLPVAFTAPPPPSLPPSGGAGGVGGTISAKEWIAARRASRAAAAQGMIETTMVADEAPVSARSRAVLQEQATGFSAPLHRIGNRPQLAGYRQPAQSGAAPGAERRIVKRIGRSTPRGALEANEMDVTQELASPPRPLQVPPPPPLPQPPVYSARQILPR